MDGNIAQSMSGAGRRKSKVKSQKSKVESRKSKVESQKSHATRGRFRDSYQISTSMAAGPTMKSA
jgi:hypothetical protein